jgi:hypothetical protein
MPGSRVSRALVVSPRLHEERPQTLERRLSCLGNPSVSCLGWHFASCVSILLLGACSSRPRAAVAPVQAIETHTAVPALPSVNDSQESCSVPTAVPTPIRPPDCSWPAAADRAGVDFAIVEMRACVSADGAVTGIVVLKDPGFGFAEHVRECFHSARFTPGKDAAGTAVPSGTPRFRVKFARSR